MFDLAVKNGLVVDGGRENAFIGTVYLKDGKIAEVFTDDSKAADASIDARGKVISPGFVDIHSHSDRTFLSDPTHESKLLGGVTFELVGQCGISATPVSDPDTPGFANFTEYADAVEKTRVSVNLGGLIGHGTLRACVAGWEMRRLTDAEMRQMRLLLDEQLSQGAFGLSLGLIYPPGSFCDTDELVALAEMVASHDKMLAVHMRNENKGVFDALDEMLSVAKKTGVRLEISHLKLMGTGQWGQANKLLHKLELARAQGVRVHGDQYPYTASNSGLTSCLPVWVADGGPAKLIERLQDQVSWKAIVADGLLELEERGGPDRVVIRDTVGNFPELGGMTLNEAASHLRLPLFEAIRQILVRCKGTVHCTYHSMDRGDMLKILSRTDIAVASDSSAYSSIRGRSRKPHPRCIGTFARFLQTVREEKLLSLEDAIYKITVLPATWLGLGDRIGRLLPGYSGDITIFDFDTIADRATYEESLIRPVGISHVLINGKAAFADGIITDERAGCFYRGQGVAQT